MHGQMVGSGNDIAVMFPGQGAQYVGMGKALAENYGTAGKVFEEADRVLGFRLSEIIFNGPEDELTLTRNCQPAIYVASWAAFSVLREKMPQLRPSYYAGLSLGEYTAYTAAGAFTFEDGLRIVQKRGELMQKCAEENHGTMACIIGMPFEKVEEVCQSASRGNPVNVANINSPGQVVISGSAEGVRAASRMASQAGAKRVIELKVSGAFHSSLMQGAAEGLAEYLAGVRITDPETPVVTNVLAREVSDVQGIRKALADQITNPVRWCQSIQYMEEKCVGVFVECGCGNVLRGLLRRIVPGAAGLGIEGPDSLDKTVEALNRLCEERQ